MGNIERIVEDSEFLSQIELFTRCGYFCVDTKNLDIFNRAKADLADIRKSGVVTTTTHSVSHKEYHEKEKILPVFKIERKEGYLLATIQGYFFGEKMLPREYKLKE
jgi:hypothetical protein